MKSLIKNITVSLRDFIFPPLCFLCNQRLELHEDRVCISCWSSFIKVDASTPAYDELIERFKEEKVIDGFVSCYLFEKEGRFQEVIHLLKYRNIKSVGIKLGNEIGLKIRNDSFMQDVRLVAPIPLHKLKLRERGYNQSIYLCKGIAEIVKVDVIPDLVLRKKYTQSQTKLNLEERKANVAEAFVLNPKYRDVVRHKSVLLVDDVITTGATIEAVAQGLKRSGADAIYAASAGLAQ